MWGAVRRYEGITDPAEAGRRVDESFLPLLEHVSGFIAYYWIDAGDGARLDGCDRRLAEHVLRRDELDAAERSGAREQCVERDLDAGEDRAAEVLPLLAHRVDRVRGAEVDDDRRATVEVVRAHGVG